MKFLFDLFPIFLFFIAYKFFDIYVATAVVILGTLLQVAWVWFRYRKVDAMLWLSLGLVIVFGGLTLYWHDATFIKWKPTLLDWLFAFTLLISNSFFKRNLVRAMLEKQMPLPDFLWARLNHAWTAFFAFMGALNLYIAFNFSEEIWVNFKLFGGIGLMFLFIIAQGLLLAKHVPPENA